MKSFMQFVGLFTGGKAARCARSVFFLAVALISTTAEAVPAIGRQATGEVRNVDHKAQTLAIATSVSPHPRIFRWDRHTRFFVGKSLATAASVQRGAAVSYTYRAPLFGEPFVTRVTVLLPMRTTPKPSVSPSPLHARHP